MKKLVSLGVILSLMPGLLHAEHPRVTELVNQKQEKMDKLKKCKGTTESLKIAGLSTLGITAVGVVANVAEAIVLKDKTDDLTAAKAELEKKELEKKKREEEAKNAKNGKKPEKNTSTTSGDKYKNFASICTDHDGWKLEAKEADKCPSCVLNCIIGKTNNVITKKTVDEEFAKAKEEFKGIIADNNKVKYTKTKSTINDNNISFIITYNHAGITCKDTDGNEIDYNNPQCEEAQNANAEGKTNTQANGVVKKGNNFCTAENPDCTFNESYTSYADAIKGVKSKFTQLNLPDINFPTNLPNDYKTKGIKCSETGNTSRKWTIRLPNLTVKKEKTFDWSQVIIARNSTGHCSFKHYQGTTLNIDDTQKTAKCKAMNKNSWQIGDSSGFVECEATKCSCFDKGGSAPYETFENTANCDDTCATRCALQAAGLDD